MAHHDLRDRRGRLLGKIRELSNGRLEVRDASGRRKGTYDPRKQETRDSRGKIVGKGNMLATLVVEPTE